MDAVLPEPSSSTYLAFLSLVKSTTASNLMHVWSKIVIYQIQQMTSNISYCDTGCDIDIGMLLLSIYLRNFGSAYVYLWWTVCRVVCLSIGIARVLYFHVIISQFIATSAPYQLTDVFYKIKTKNSLYQNYIPIFIFKCKC